MHTQPIDRERGRETERKSEIKRWNSPLASYEHFKRWYTLWSKGMYNILCVKPLPHKLNVISVKVNVNHGLIIDVPQRSLYDVLAWWQLNTFFTVNESCAVNNQCTQTFMVHKVHYITIASVCYVYIHVWGCVVNLTENFPKKLLWLYQILMSFSRNIFHQLCVLNCYISCYCNDCLSLQNFHIILTKFCW